MLGIVYLFCGKRGRVLAVPGFDLINAPAVGFDGQVHFYRFRDGGAEFEAVAVEETVNQDRRGPFIASESGVVLDRAEAEGGRLAHEVRSLVTGGVAGGPGRIRGARGRRCRNASRPRAALTSGGA